MISLKTSELSKIPFVDIGNLNGRTIATLSFYADSNWHFWIPTAAGLVKINGQPAEACYFGNDAENPEDVYLEFLNFIAQRCCWPSVVRPFYSIQQDFLIFAQQ
jgi:hypothetical protein